MSIRFSCSCGRKLKVSDEKIGMKVLCSSCGATLKVPKKSQDEYWQDVPGGIVIGLMCWGAYFLSSQILTGHGNYPPLGQVTGRVILNGQPLPNAIVRFAPKDPIYGEAQNGKHLAASVSMGVTDDNGNYSLLYVTDVKGAYVGMHKVSIEAKDASGRERLLPEFNSRTTLDREVKTGAQVMDFDVKSNDSTSNPASAPAPQVQP